MPTRTPDEHLTWYVLRYYGCLMTEPEWLAYLAFLAEARERSGLPPELLTELRTTDPEALALMHDGVEPFRQRVRDRILREHEDRVVLNYCPRCGQLARTPRARQCQWCFHDWHSVNGAHEHG